MSNHLQVLRIYVKVDDLRAGIKLSSYDNLRRSNRWVPFEQRQATFSLKKKSKSLVTITRTQFPLTLSHACTTHKVLRISLSKAVVIRNLCKNKVFQPGQVYVALRRIANFEGIYLIGSCNRAFINTN